MSNDLTFQHFEQDDPDLFTTKIKYILENDVEDMEMVFAEEQYSEGGKVEEVRATSEFGNDVTKRSVWAIKSPTEWLSRPDPVALCNTATILTYQLAAKCIAQIYEDKQKHC
jgi:hypothetical protein